MLLLNLIISILYTTIQSVDTGKWEVLSPGLEMLNIDIKSIITADHSGITIVRANPKLWELLFAGISQSDGASTKTAKEWCKSNNLVAAINAGMFNDDYRTHTGYLKFRDHVNSKGLNSYKSVLAFDPVEGNSLGPFKIYDLDEPGTTIKSICKAYRSAIQNLRMIKKPGINVWAEQDRRWSEAAIGEDNNGQILFIFSRSPLSIYELNNILLKSGIGIVTAQHLEGGPEAQLYLKAGKIELELSGSYETGYNENDDNNYQTPIPNIIGIRPK